MGRESIDRPDHAAANNDNGQTLIETHRPLVEQVLAGFAHRYHRLVDREELRSAGLLGLVEAARRFEPDRGVPFGGFAVRRIRGAMLDVLRGNDWAPRSVREDARRFDAARQALTDRHGGPDTERLALHLAVDPDRLRRIDGEVAKGAIRSLDERSEWGSYAERITDPDLDGPEETIERRELQGYVRDALASLPGRQRIVMVGIYLEGRSPEELAELLGVTSSRISQIRGEALEAMRDGIERQYAVSPMGPPKGRVAIRQARFAAAISARSSWRDRILHEDCSSRTAQPAGTPVAASGC